MVRASLGLSPRIRPGKGFTILEMLVATTVLVLLLTLIVSVLNQTTSTIRQSTAQADAFTAARSAFDLVIRHLSQAILNPYWDYDNPTSPTRYLRQSDLHFVVRQNTQDTRYGQEVFFQAPDGFSLSPSYQSAAGLLNACGYRVVYGSDDGFRAGSASAPRWRYRLMQSLQPAESLQVFDNKDVTNPQWIQSALKTELPVAENIVAMIVWPRLAAGDDPNGASLTSNYQYNSRDNARTSRSLPPPTNSRPPYRSPSSPSAKHRLRGWTPAHPLRLRRSRAPWRGSSPRSRNISTISTTSRKSWPPKTSPFRSLTSPSS